MSSVSGQLNAEERRLLKASILEVPTKPKIVLEVGTWLGGGSTLHFLKALEANGEGHLWGIEADRSIYDQMLDNIRTAAPEALQRFTPLFGLSQTAIPQWLSEQGADVKIDVVFLDGGDNPYEQITEFKLLAHHMPIGGQLMAHDAKLRKGKWLHPYLEQLDNWEVQLHDVSEEGFLKAVKIKESPSEPSQKRAEALLRKLRMQPVELVARFLPSRVCGFLLDMMPNKLRERLAHGR